MQAADWFLPIQLNGLTGQLEQRRQPVDQPNDSRLSTPLLPVTIVRFWDGCQEIVRREVPEAWTGSFV